MGQFSFAHKKKERTLNDKTETQRNRLECKMSCILFIESQVGKRVHKLLSETLF